MDKVRRLVNAYYYNLSKDPSMILTKFRLWKCTIDDIDKIKKWDAQMQLGKIKIDADLLNNGK